MREANEMLPFLQVKDDALVSADYQFYSGEDSVHGSSSTLSPDTVSFMDQVPFSAMIDNSTLVYIPIRLPCGVVAHCRPEVLARCPQVLQDLNIDLNECLLILPRSVHALVRRSRIWINLSYCYGLKKKPCYLNHSTTHHHEGWLIWVRDNPDKARGIEIYSCFDYLKMRNHWNGCGLILHELSHLIHQHALPDGLENGDVKNAFQNAVASGIYERTLRRDWAGLEIDYDMAYAMVNHKEFFAEMSVSFLSKNYPELNEADRNSMNMSSPPLFMQTVVERVQKQLKYAALEVRRIDYLQRLRWLWFLPWRKRLPLPCNKFYPFTSGQLKHCDPGLHSVVAKLWRQVEQWKDDEDADDDENCWLRIKRCLPRESFNL